MTWSSDAADFSDPFDRTYEAGVRSERSRQEDWKERVDHFRRGVGEKAHRGQCHDVAAERRPQRALP